MHGYRLILMLSLTLGAVVQAAPTPELAWSYTLETERAVAPLVAKVTDHPGNLIFLVDEAEKSIQCIDASKREAWRFSDSALTSIALGPVLGNAQQPGKEDLALADSAGGLWLLNAATGMLKWQASIAPAQPVVLSRAELNENEADEVLIVHNQGLSVFSEAGEALWRYPEAGADPVAGLALAVADTDENGVAEVFFLEKHRLLSLEADGYLRWEYALEEEVAGDLLVADADADSLMEVYALSRSGKSLYCWDADTGDLLRQVALDAPERALAGGSASRIAAANFNYDEYLELVLCHASGMVALVSASGDLLWSQRSDQADGLNPALLDVTGDGAIEIVLSTSKGALFALDEGGALVWRMPQEKAAFSAPVCSDLDGNGRTDLLVQGEDGYLRAYALPAKALAPLLPWPMPRHDAAASAAIPLPSFDEEKALPWVWESRPLLEHGGFEAPLDAQKPQVIPGWSLSPDSEGVCRVDSESSFQGKAALHTKAETKPIQVLSDAMEIASNLRTVSATLFVRSEDKVGVSLRWYNKGSLIRENSFRIQEPNEAGWRRCLLRELHRPVGAQSMRLVLLLESGAAYWDGAEVEGSFEFLPQFKVMSNQVGYDTEAPKYFTAWANFKAEEATFTVQNRSGMAVYHGELGAPESMEDGQGYHWGGYYYRASFSDLKETGDYRIAVRLDGQEEQGPLFRIAPELLWRSTFRPVFSALEAHRCLEACAHLKAGDLAGGWHQGSRVDKDESAALLWDLLSCYQAGRKIFSQLNNEGDFLRAISWGADYLRADLERRLSPASAGAETTISKEEAARYAAALALAARFLEEKEACLAAAQRAFHFALEEAKPNAFLFSAAMDLWRATGEAPYQEALKKLYVKPFLECHESCIAYGDQFDDEAQFMLAMAAQQQADAWIKESQNPFGLAGKKDQQGLRHFPEEGGNSAMVLEAALDVAKAYRYRPDPAYLRFVYDQLNWVLGNNPAGTSLLSGFGATQPAYIFQDRSSEGLLRSPQGVFLHGLCPRPGQAPGLDQEGGDEGSNGYALRNNLRYLNVLTQMKRVYEIIHVLQRKR